MRNFAENLRALYSIYIYLPLSQKAKILRDFSRKIRRKSSKHQQNTYIATEKWKKIIKSSSFRLVEAEKRNGNVSISELGLLSLLAKSCPTKSKIFEIGTFDGRTTLNLAVNSSELSEVFTLDLPNDTKTLFDADGGEKHYIQKPESGARYKNTKYEKKINQFFGDSATFNFYPFFNKCSMVFVDGSHAYEYAKSDSDSAIKMVKEGGVVIWHDYGVWEGVTRALEELEEREKLNLKHIDGTSLVYWKKPAGISYS